MRPCCSVSAVSLIALTGLVSAAACNSGSSGESSTREAVSPLTAASASATQGTLPSWARAERLVGRPPAGEAVSIQVYLRMRAEADAQAELNAVSDPNSARFGQYLTDADFDRKYAPTSESVAAVRAHLEAHGLTVGHVPDSRLYVPARGTVADIEKAFNTEIGRYQDGGRVRRAPMREPSLPANVAGLVLGTMGLVETLPLKPHTMAYGAIRGSELASATPHISMGTDTCSEWYGQAIDYVDPPYGGGFPYPLLYATCGYTPPKVRQAYGIDSAVRKGNDGKGVSIAIVDAYLSPTLLSDAQTYAAQNDPDYPLASAQLRIVLAPTTNPAPFQDPGWWTEASLDVEAAHTTAPGANLVFVSAATPTDQDLVSAINTVVDGKLATIITNSYGTVEDSGFVNFVLWNATLTQAGLKGIGVYFSSGDYGDNRLPGPNFPASHPNVTAVGGTSLALGQTNETIFEVGWETGVSYLESSSGGLGGGGLGGGGLGGGGLGGAAGAAGSGGGSGSGGAGGSGGSEPTGTSTQSKGSTTLSSTHGGVTSTGSTQTSSSTSNSTSSTTATASGDGGAELLEWFPPPPGFFGYGSAVGRAACTRNPPTRSGSFRAPWLIFRASRLV